MNAKSEKRERSHATILDSAARLLRDRGIAGARVADVMHGAGLTVGGFYAHFPTKEALLREVLARTSGEVRRKLVEGTGEERPRARLETVLTRYLAAEHRDHPELGCPFPAVVGEIGTSAPEYAEVLGEQLEAMRSAMETTLPDETRLTRKQTTLALVALMYGGLSLSRALGKTKLSDEILGACRAFGMLAAGDER